LPIIFNVEAKAADPSPRIPELQKMFQNLLADRFQLAFHYEPRMVPGYALVVSKTGSRLQLAKPGETESILGIPAKFKPSSIDSPLDRTITLTAQQYPITMLANILAQLGPGPVVDMTGLKDVYDFKLTWNDATGPTLFTALRQQLGLQLEARKVEVKTIVIDRAEKPKAN
jgi:uncharacterized protein (TIGR03435 family)